MTPYNPDHYSPQFQAPKRAHTGNSLTLKIWALVALTVSLAASFYWPSIAAEHFASFIPDSGASACKHLIPFSLLLLGSWAGLFVYAFGRFFPSPLLTLLRRRYKNSPNPLVRADLAAIRLAFPLQSLWTLASLALFAWILFAHNPFEHAAALCIRRGVDSLMTPLVYILEVCLTSLPFLPLLVGNLLGAIPKDPQCNQNEDETSANEGEAALASLSLRGNKKPQKKGSKNSATAVLNPTRDPKTASPLRPFLNLADSLHPPRL